MAPGNESKVRLGDLEHEILQVVWERGPLSAEACRGALVRALKDSTVRTVLRRLEEKGLVTHVVDGRSYLYSAARAPAAVAANAVKGVIDRFCGGSLEALLVGLVDGDVVDGAELERLAKKVAAAKARNKGGKS